MCACLDSSCSLPPNGIAHSLVRSCTSCWHSPWFLCAQRTLHFIAEYAKRIALYKQNPARYAECYIEAETYLGIAHECHDEYKELLAKQEQWKEANTVDTASQPSLPRSDVLCEAECSSRPGSLKTFSHCPAAYPAKSSSRIPVTGIKPVIHHTAVPEGQLPPGQHCHHATNTVCPGIQAEVAHASLVLGQHSTYASSTGSLSKASRHPPASSHPMSEQVKEPKAAATTAVNTGYRQINSQPTASHSAIEIQSEGCDAAPAGSSWSIPAGEAYATEECYGITPAVGSYLSLAPGVSLPPAALPERPDPAGRASEFIQLPGSDVLESTFAAAAARSKLLQRQHRAEDVWEAGRRQLGIIPDTQLGRLQLIHRRAIGKQLQVARQLAPQHTPDDKLMLLQHPKSPSLATQLEEWVAERQQKSSAKQANRKALQHVKQDAATCDGQSVQGAQQKKRSDMAAVAHTVGNGVRAVGRSLECLQFWVDPEQRVYQRLKQLKAKYRLASYGVIFGMWRGLIAAQWLRYKGFSVDEPGSGPAGTPAYVPGLAAAGVVKSRDLKLVQSHVQAALQDERAKMTLAAALHSAKVREVTWQYEKHQEWNAQNGTQEPFQPVERKKVAYWVSELPEEDEDAGEVASAQAPSSTLVQPLEGLFADELEELEKVANGIDIPWRGFAPLSSGTSSSAAHTRQLYVLDDEEEWFWQEQAQLGLRKKRLAAKEKALRRQLMMSQFPLLVSSRRSIHADMYCAVWRGQNQVASVHLTLRTNYSHNMHMLWHQSCPTLASHRLRLAAGSVTHTCYFSNQHGSKCG